MNNSMKSIVNPLDMMDYSIVLNTQTGCLYLKFNFGPLKDQYLRLTVDRTSHQEEFSGENFYVLANFKEEYEEWLMMNQ